MNAEPGELDVGGRIGFLAADRCRILVGKVAYHPLQCRVLVDVPEVCLRFALLVHADAALCKQLRQL